MKFKLLLVAALACAAGFAKAESYDAAAVLKRADQAIGASALKSVRYAGSGSAWQFGQGYKAGAPWPKLNLSRYSRAINYDTAASLEDVTRSRAEPTGGGAVPLSGEQRLAT